MKAFFHLPVTVASSSVDSSSLSDGGDSVGVGDAYGDWREGSAGADDGAFLIVPCGASVINR